MTTYDTIGRSYTTTRRPDPRIVDRLVELLGLPFGSRIADVGAGTGNYTNALADRGYHLDAIEPSAVMREQAAPHRDVKWHAGDAGHIPLADGAVDGVVSTLVIHHIPDLAAAFREMNRVSGSGPIVILTFDYRTADRFWLADYFPTLAVDALRTTGPIADVSALLQEVTGKRADIFPFMVPPDLTDLFLAAGWRRPEMYLDAGVRAGISSFALADTSAVNEGVARLRDDLESGLWEQEYGSVRELSEFDAGYRFVRAHAAF